MRKEEEEEGMHVYCSSIYRVASVATKEGKLL
jgi:hypothetical protein